MLDLLKKLMGTGESTRAGARGKAGGGEPRHDIHLATCAVFLEVARIDNEFEESELEHLLAVFEREYGLSRDEVLELENAAREQLEKRTDLWTFTNVINRHYSNEEKYRIVKLLWELVYADGRLDDHENYFMHKLRRLLKLTHRDLMNAKLEVLENGDKT